MKIVKADEAGLGEAARTLLAGGVAVIPTDTVYGLAAHPGFPEAVQRLCTLVCLVDIFQFNQHTFQSVCFCVLV